MAHQRRDQLLYHAILVGIALLGVACTLLLGVQQLVHSLAYTIIATTLLCVGLYFAVYFIDKAEAKRHWRIVVIAITVGVLCKYAIIMAIALALMGQWQYAVFAMALAQIDPLSVAALSNDTRMSPHTKTVLNMWASFDDPMTTIATPLILGIIATFAHQHIANSNGWQEVAVSLLPFTLALLAVACFSVARKFLLPRALVGAHNRFRKNDAAKTGVVGAAALVSIPYKLFSIAALSGWFVRPSWLRLHATAVAQWALYGATFLLGMVLAGGVDIWGGICLGIATYCAQIIVAWIVMRLAAGKQTAGFSKKDIWHLALAQQNGITAIVLALNLEVSIPGSVAAISLAIMVINALNFVANWAFDVYTAKAA